MADGQGKHQQTLTQTQPCATARDGKSLKGHPNTSNIAFKWGEGFSCPNPRAIILTCVNITASQ